MARRRSKGPVRRRGWIVRRALMSADLLGLITAFVLAELVYPVQMNRAGSLSPLAEYASMAIALPIWVVAAKVYGLYDKDEERADHSTTDDFAGVVHLVTVCARFMYAASLLTAWFNPQFAKIFVFWLLAIAALTFFGVWALWDC